MRRNLSLLAFVLSLISMAAFAQTSTMDSAKEKNVQITQGPSITNITGTTATINWTTDKKAANHVKYRVANGAWKSAYTAGGSTNHSAQLTGLQPSQTVDWQILTQDGDVRTSGQFQTASTATGTAPDVNASTGANNSGTNSASASHVPLYRGDNPNNKGEHVYTTNQSEITAAGWTPVGTVGYVASSQQSGTEPLYRILRSNGDHFYTTSAQERDSVLSQGGKDEGTVGYIATTQQPGTTPLYRLYNPTSGMHLYTTNPGDLAAAAAQGYHQEQITGYLFQS
jgi:hypothetical protein